MGLERRRRLSQLGCGLAFTVGVDDLGPSLTLGLGRVAEGVKGGSVLVRG